MSVCGVANSPHVIGNGWQPPPTPSCDQAPARFLWMYGCTNNPCTLAIPSAPWHCVMGLTLRCRIGIYTTISSGRFVGALRLFAQSLLRLVMYVSGFIQFWTRAPALTWTVY